MQNERAAGLVAAVLSAALLWSAGAAAETDSVGKVESLPAQPGRHWVWVYDAVFDFMSAGRASLVDADSGRFLGMVNTGYSFTQLTLPRDHGIVANGWYFRELNEVWFWRQSHRLIGGPRVWSGHESETAVLFWWFNMATSVRWSVTPRPTAATPPAQNRGRRVPPGRGVSRCGAPCTSDG